MTLSRIALLVWVGAGTVGGRSAETQDQANPPDGLQEAINDGLRAFLKELFKPVEQFIENHGDDLVGLLVRTPHPDTVFGTPTKAPWPGLYDYYWRGVIPAALFLYGVSIGLVVLLETTSHLFSSYHRSKLRKRSVAGLIGILSWWWVAAFSMRLVHGLTTYLVPDLSNITLFQTVSFAAMGVLGTVVALSTDLGLFLLIGMVYSSRIVLLYLFVLLMPLLIALWIPGVGPFATVARLVKQVAGFYVPFLFLPVPVAVLLRVAHVLGTRGGGGLGGVGAWLSALVIPLLALFLPLVLVWRTGALFLLARHTTRSSSLRTARQRVGKARAAGQQATAGGRRLAAGARSRLPSLGNDANGPNDQGSGRRAGFGRSTSEDSSDGDDSRLLGASSPVSAGRKRLANVVAPGESGSENRSSSDATTTGGSSTDARGGTTGTGFRTADSLLGDRSGSDPTGNAPSDDASNAASDDPIADRRTSATGDTGQPDVRFGTAVDGSEPVDADADAGRTEHDDEPSPNSPDE